MLVEEKLGIDPSLVKPSNGAWCQYNGGVGGDGCGEGDTMHAKWEDRAYIRGPWDIVL